MCYTTTKKLLDKYNCQYVAGERHSNKTKKKNKDYMKLQRRYIILEDLSYEVPFNVNNIQIKQIRTLIERYNTSFKKLHGKAGEKTIILAFIFFIKKTENPTIQLTQYTITTRYGLTNTIFQTILCRLLEDYMKNSPIIPEPTTKYNHEILLEEYPLTHGGI